MEEAAADPERYQICKNGAIRDRLRSRFVGGADITTKFDNASAMRANDIKKKTWEDNFMAGMAAAAGDGGSAERAVQLVGQNITGIAINDHGMPAVKAAAEVARLGGFVQREAGVNVNVLNVVDGRGLTDLVDLIREKDVIDVE